MSRVGASDRAGAFRRVGDRDRPSFGPSGSVVLPLAENAQACRAAPLGDRDSVNSARPMRTRFYSARRTRVGIATAASGDCVEMNSTAASHRSCDAGRETRFRPGIKSDNQGMTRPDDVTTNTRPLLARAIDDRIFGGMARVSNGCQENGLWRDMHTRGQMHPWRTLDLAIPREVASPQSLFPFHQALQA